jgi:two-component system LytT family sensor kinase
MVRPEEGMPSSHIFGHSFAMWYVWIPVTPIVFWLHRRFPLTKPRWPVAVIAHLLTFCAVFLVQSWVTVVVGHMTGHVLATTSWWRYLTFLVVELLLYDMLIYIGIVAVAAWIDSARRYRDRDLRASQLETQLERAHVEMLQTQLQPHFLFNALNAIAMLVRRDRKQEAVDVIVGFGELLRYVLDESGTIDVSLGEELRFVRQYLEIERVRLGERLSVTIDVTPGIERAVVPNLILQPIVENALKHSITVRPEGGRVRIGVERRGDVLRLEVEDDGPGLPDGFTIEGAGGVGLRNLRDRLSAFFGSSGRLDLRNVASGGLLAVVEIPFREEARATPQLARTG